MMFWTHPPVSRTVQYLQYSTANLWSRELNCQSSGHKHTSLMLWLPTGLFQQREAVMPILSPFNIQYACSIDIYWRAFVQQKKRWKFHEIFPFLFILSNSIFYNSLKICGGEPSRRQSPNGKTRKQIERVIKRILMFALLLHGCLSWDVPVATLSMNT